MPEKPNRTDDFTSVVTAAAHVGQGFQPGLR
jgi:hypothetical protein